MNGSGEVSLVIPDLPTPKAFIAHSTQDTQKFTKMTKHRNSDKGAKMDPNQLIQDIRNLLDEIEQSTDKADALTKIREVSVKAQNLYGWVLADGFLANLNK